MEAESLGGLQNVVDGLGPFEGLGLFVMDDNESPDVGLQSFVRTVDATPDLLFSDESEKPLYLIDP